MRGFIEMSKYAGMREDLVQAGGGNSSYKCEKNRMVIKASGYQLTEISEQRGYAIVNPEVIANAFLENDNIDIMTEADSKRILKEAFIEGDKPSIETFLHSISGKYTLHTHPIVVNTLTCRKDGMQVLKSLFPDALIVPYATPGVELAKAYFKAYSKNKEEVGVVFLQNHGLLVSGETAESVINKTEDIVRCLEKYLDINLSRYHNVTVLYNVIRDGVVWNVTDKNVLDVYYKLNKLWEHTFCPDCIVFLGKKVCVAERDFCREDLDKFMSSWGKPVIFAYENELYINAETVKKSLEIQSVLSFSAQVMSLNEEYECNFLSEEEQNFLLDWDAEKYRKNMK